MRETSLEEWECSRERGYSQWDVGEPSRGGSSAVVCGNFLSAAAWRILVIQAHWLWRNNLRQPTYPVGREEGGRSN